MLCKFRGACCICCRWRAKSTGGTYIRGNLVSEFFASGSFLSKVPTIGSLFVAPWPSEKRWCPDFNWWRGWAGWDPRGEEGGRDSRGRTVPSERE